MEGFRKAMKRFGATEEITASLLGEETPVEASETVEISAESLSCPLCKGTMTVVSLYGGKKAKFCKADRSCVPFKI